MPKVKDTICWRCKRPGTGTCSWDKSKGIIPVEGWKAERVYVGGIGVSYKVFECPLFSPNENYDEQERRARLYADFTEENERPAHYKKVDVKQIRRLFRDGLTNGEIASKLGANLSTVKYHRTKWKKENETK